MAGDLRRVERSMDHARRHMLGVTCLLSGSDPPAVASGQGNDLERSARGAAGEPIREGWW